MGIFNWSDESQTCSECGKTFTVNHYYDFSKLDYVSDESYVGCCSKRCFERMWAATMDFYDVDDPNNPAYSNPAYSDSSSSSPVEDKKSEEPSILKNVLSILFLIYAIALWIYHFFS